MKVNSAVPQSNLGIYQMFCDDNVTNMNFPISLNY